MLPAELSGAKYVGEPRLKHHATAIPTRNMGTTEEWPREKFYMTSTKTETQFFRRRNFRGPPGGGAMAYFKQLYSFIYNQPDRRKPEEQQEKILCNAFFLALLLAL